MFCPICGTKLEENAKECFTCGYCLNHSDKNEKNTTNDSQTKCPTCGSVIGENDTICPICSTTIEKIPEPENSFDKICEKKTEQKVSVNQTKSKKKIINIFLTVIIIFIIVILLFFVLKSKKSNTINDTSKELSPKQTQENTNTENDTLTKNDTNTEDDTVAKKDTNINNSTNTEDDMQTANMDRYLGYWNIANNTDKELTIQKITDNTVQFSLWYYRLDSIENVVASLDNNIAHFSTGTGEESIKGTLTFQKNSISVKIIQTERVYMPVETMLFKERHEESWQKTSSSMQYSIKITNTPVNVYDGPGYSYSIVDTITDKGTCTIAEKVQDNEGYVWAKLTSGIGWINLEETTAEEVQGYSEYILPDSATRLLTYDDIKDLSSKQLKLARNEIYARHGRKFDDDEIRTYFESQSWYNGTIKSKDFSESMLSKIEKKNVAFIKKYE